MSSPSWKREALASNHVFPCRSWKIRLKWLIQGRRRLQRRAEWDRQAMSERRGRASTNMAQVSHACLTCCRARINLDLRRAEGLGGNGLPALARIVTTAALRIQSAPYPWCLAVLGPSRSWPCLKPLAAGRCAVVCLSSASSLIWPTMKASHQHDATEGGMRR